METFLNKARSADGEPAAAGICGMAAQPTAGAVRSLGPRCAPASWAVPSLPLPCRSCQRAVEHLGSTQTKVRAAVRCRAHAAAAGASDPAACPSGRMLTDLAAAFSCRPRRHASTLQGKHVREQRDGAHYQRQVRVAGGGGVACTAVDLLSLGGLVPSRAPVPCPSTARQRAAHLNSPIASCCLRYRLNMGTWQVRHGGRLQSREGCCPCCSPMGGGCTHLTPFLHSAAGHLAVRAPRPWRATAAGSDRARRVRDRPTCGGGSGSGSGAFLCTSRSPLPAAIQAVEPLERIVLFNASAKTYTGCTDSNKSLCWQLALHQLGKLRVHGHCGPRRRRACNDAGAVAESRKGVDERYRTLVLVQKT